MSNTSGGGKVRLQVALDLYLLYLPAPKRVEPKRAAASICQIFRFAGSDEPSPAPAVKPIDTSASGLLLLASVVVFSRFHHCCVVGTACLFRLSSMNAAALPGRCPG